MRLLLLGSIALVLVVSGCAGSGKSTPASSSPASAEPVAPTSEFGSISGLIIDEEDRPIGNVRVAVLELSKETRSDAAGAFVFNEVPPGKYKLLTESLGYDEAGRAVEVVANEATEVTMQLRAIVIEPDPFVDMLPFTGIIRCSVNPSYAMYPCEGVTGTSKAAFDFFSNKNYTLSEMVVEFVWTPVNAVMGQELEGDLCKYKADRMQTLCDGALSADGADNYKYRTGGSPIVLRADKLDKKNGHWIVGAGGPLTSPYPVYEQAFDVYVSLCYFEACSEDYSAIPK